ncbi:Probable CCR4-associated factor 1 homolog 5 [Linum grandiflorum]
MAPFIREVWNWNLRPELAILEHALQSFPILSVDCEFPGFLLQTPRNATDDLRYKDLKHNVDQTHIIQLGVTLSDLHQRGVFGTWQFNFEFNLDRDVHTKETIAFLRGHGIDFESHRADGIKRTRFAAEFISLMARRTSPLIWVTFHGLYDFAHILKVLTNGTPLPNKPSGFRDLLGCYFEKIVDLKVMAKLCDGISHMEVGLQKLADLLDVKREGEAHQAGSDSLLTALVLSNMRKRFQVHQHLFADVLYGISEKIERRTPTFRAAHYSSQQLLCQPMPVLLVPCYRPYQPPAQCRLLPLHTPFIMDQLKPNRLRCFGAARQVPQRLYTLDELKLNGIEAAWNAFGFTSQQIFYLSLGLLFIWTLDAVSFNGGLGSLVLDTIGHNLSQKYHNRVIQHEAGHFLIAYLVQRVTPCPAWKLCKRKDLLMSKLGWLSWISSSLKKSVSSAKFLPRYALMTLSRFSCIALAGVATEYILYGYSEGGLADINKLDMLLKGLGFTQKKADSHRGGNSIWPWLLSMGVFEKKRSFWIFACSDATRTWTKVLAVADEIGRMNNEISATERCASHQTCNLPNLRARGTIRATWFQPSCTDSEFEGTANQFRKNGNAFSSALERAFRRYRNDMDGWQELVRRIMKLDFSWGTSAAHYEELYSKSVARARAASS